MSEYLFTELWRIYQDIWDLVPIGIHAIDEQGKTQVYNRTMGEIDGYEPGQAVSRNLFELFPQLTEDTSTLWQTLTTGQPMQIPKQVYFSRSGRKIVTRNQTRPLIYGGKVIGAVEISTAFNRIDVSNQRLLAKPAHLFTLDHIIGHSTAMEQARHISRRAARTDSTVLIFGETGVGKELFAQGIHTASARATHAFVPQNCAALPATLLEGMLFGTRRGGFTGAVDRPGLFEVARGGTLLFDEIHTLDVALQAKLLRVLQERILLPIGGIQPVPVDTRVIATMNIHPLEAVERGLLREDLFYRLSVVHIHVPPLRERREDIQSLVNHFVGKYSKLYQLSIPGVEPDVLRWFEHYDWPGNVRQLEHMIEGAMNLVEPNRAIAMEQIESISDLLPVKQQVSPQPSNEPTGQSIITEATVSTAFLTSGKNVSQTARSLGMSRQRLQYYLRKYQLK